MSTSPIDKGKQILTWDYRNPASSASFNRLYTDLIPSGIYAGGLFSRSSDTVVSLSRMTVVIHSNEREADRITVRIETTVDQDLSLATSLSGVTCDPTLEYIVARFGWEDVESNFMDFIPVRFSDDPGEYRPNYIQSKDIILGRVLYERQSDGNWTIKHQHPFDYTRRHWAFIPDEQNIYNAFKVQTCHADSSKVHVKGGSIATSKGYINVVGGDFPISGFAPTGDMGRYDLVYVDSEGKIQIQYGTPGQNPAAPIYGSRRVLAEIRRGPNRADIIGDDIFSVNPLGQMGTLEAGEFSLADKDNYFLVKTVEAALKQTWEKAKSLEQLLGSLTSYAQKTREDLEDHVADVVDEGMVHGIEVIDEIPLD